jgi:hypothetical protein
MRVRISLSAPESLPFETSSSTIRKDRDCARKFFQAAGDNIEEEQAVDDAMYSLHALRSSFKHGTPTTEATGYSGGSKAA